MSLSKGVYGAFEDVVGPEYISEEPAVLDSYAFQYQVPVFTPNAEPFTFRPEAVILPNNTEEVQAIVRTCNRNNIKYKAFSTGWSAMAAPGSEGVIQIDLRRMNRIIDIDEKNMIAVVEPYVVSAQLQAELMKRGLNCPIISAGANCTACPASMLADGSGWSTTSLSSHHRSLLGVEWVLPTGELLRLGSVGAGAGWFCGDGPGPSLKGIMRGTFGAIGSLGVFTKSATKVYHWPGPSAPTIKGVSPHYMVDVPRAKFYCLSASSWEKLIDGADQIAESEVAAMETLLNPFWFTQIFTESNSKFAELYPRIVESLKEDIGFLMVIVVANSEREFEYQTRALQQIMAETDLKASSFVDDPAVQREMLWKIIRVSAGSRHYIRASGSFANPSGVVGATGRMAGTIMAGVEFIKERTNNGQFLYTGGNDWSGYWYEYGHYNRTEQNTPFDPADIESTRAAHDLMVEGTAYVFDKFGDLPILIGDEFNQKFGPYQHNQHLWLEKIKKALDPNISADPTGYIIPKE